ncbi:kelch-like protein 28 [Liolophura sinensis]|uniref:kelch-like protein 28 n=1 Tax=Liolophura sinensis TaxID=3198878 RepID=UPI003158C927
MEVKREVSDESLAEMSVYSQQLLYGLNELRQRQLLCDVVLIADDAKVAAHRVVLAGCSPYFRAMFTGSLVEKDKPEIELQSVDSIGLRTIVEYAYRGSVVISQHNVQSVLPAANLFQLTPLLRNCCRFLQSQLHPSNCLGIWKFAETHSCFDLYNKVFSFILQHFTKVMRTEEFKDLTVEEVCEVLCQDNLSVSSERCVLEAVDLWLQADLPSRRDSLKNLLPCIRLSQLPLTVLNKFLDSHQHLIEDSICRKLIEEALGDKLDAERRLKRSKADCSSCRARCPSKALCAVGGKCGLFASLDSVEIYCALNRSWTEITPLSTCRNECAVTSVSSRLYVLGGIICENRENGTYRYHDNRVEYWDPESNVWHEKSPMIHRRSAFAVVTFQENLYALGGYDGQVYHRSVERYCWQSDEWTPVTAMQQCRSCFSACILEGFIYVIGGYGPPCLNSVEKYDPVSKEWGNGDPMVEKRINYGAGVACGCLFVVGGHNGCSNLSSVERYDPVGDQWTNVTGIDRQGQD